MEIYPTVTLESLEFPENVIVFYAGELPPTDSGEILKKLASLAIASLLALTLTACVPGVPMGSSGSEDTKTETTEKVLTLGSTGQTEDGVSATLVSLKKAGKKGFSTPKNEYFLIAEFELVNNSEEDVAISSALCFDLVSEGGKTYDMDYFYEVESGLDGTIKPGRKLVGQVVFDVNPENLYYLTFEPSLFGEGLEFQFSSNDFAG